MEERPRLARGPAGLGPGSDQPALLGTVYRGVGTVLARTGKPDPAMSAFQRSVEILAGLSQDNLAAPEFRNNLADSLNIAGTLQVQIGKPVEAMESFQRRFWSRKD